MKPNKTGFRKLFKLELTYNIWGLKIISIADPRLKFRRNIKGTSTDI